MKRYFSTLLLLLAGVVQVSEAQVTLQQIHNYEAGNQRTYKSVDPGLMDPKPGGANQNWDFSQWPEGSTVTQKVITASQAPEGETFPKADLAVQYGENTRYLKKQNNGNRVRGLVALQGGQKLQITYLKPIRPYKRPFNYREVHRDTGRRQYQIMSFSYKGTGTMTTKAIGFGTLKLPTATYDSVVLLKNKQSWVDTPSGGIGGNVNTEMVTYTWYQSGKPHPLLRLDSMEVKSSFRNSTSANLIYFKQNTTSVEALSKRNFSINAFVSGNQLTVQSRSGTSSNLTLKIYTINGKPVKHYRMNLQSGQQESLPLPPMASGIYLLKATPQNQPFKPVMEKIHVR